MWISINADHRSQKVGTTMAFEINRHGIWNRRENQSEFEAIIKENNSKKSFITYGTPLLYNGTLNHNLGKLSYMEASRRFI